jgi:RIO kinase 2
MNLIVKLAEYGLIHCDFNEFNLMVNEETEEVTLIDFPQMVSTSHENADYYFARDVQCVRTYFNKRFKMQTDEYPVFSEDSGDKQLALDTMVNASGASKKLTKEESKQFEEFLEQEAAERVKQGDDANGELDEEEADEDEEQQQEQEQQQQAEEEGQDGQEAAAAVPLEGKQETEEVEEDDEEVDPKKKLREQRKLERRLAKYKAMDAKGKGKVNKFSETHAEELEELVADQATRTQTSSGQQQTQEVVIGEDGEPVLDVDRIRRRVHRSYETKKQRGYQKGRKAQNRVKNRTKQAHRDQIKMDM